MRTGSKRVETVETPREFDYCRIMNDSENVAAISAAPETGARTLFPVGRPRRIGAIVWGRTSHAAIPLKSVHDRYMG